MLNLPRPERLRLMKFVCSFAWTDLHVSAGERQAIERMASHTDFDDEDREHIAQWLSVPPSPEEVDPTQIPTEHRQRFLDAIRSVIMADGNISQSERDSMDLFEELVRTAAG